MNDVAGVLARWLAGIEVCLVGENVKLSPRSSVTFAMQQAVLEVKAELISYLAAKERAGSDPPSLDGASYAELELTHFTTVAMPFNDPASDDLFEIPAGTPCVVCFAVWKKLRHPVVPEAR